MRPLMALIDRYYVKKPLLREAMTRTIYGNRDRDVVLFKRRIRVNTLRENGYYRAARKAGSLSLFRDEAVTLQNLMLFAKPRMTFVDVGANIGIFSVMMSSVSRIYPEFDVVAFEVHPATHGRLAVNAGRHGFTTHNIALGAVAGPATFVEGAVSHVTTTVANMNAYNLSGRRFEAQTRRLDGYSFDKPLFLKIDVEGQKLDVLHGAEGLFDEDRIDAVFVDGSADREAASDFLEQRGFLIVNGRTLWHVDHPNYLLALRSAAYPEARARVRATPSPAVLN